MSGPEPAGGTREVRALTDVAAHVAAGGRGLPVALRRAAEEAPPAAVEEVLLQSHLFLGFPRALAAMRAWRRLEGATPVPRREERVDGGRESGDGRSSGTDDPRARGEDLCRRVYGSAYRSLRENVRRLHPALDEWMLRHGYGEVLGREGLDPATRELCIVATLAADEAPPGPLRSHLRGALRVGAPPAAVEGALEAGLRRLPPGADRRRSRRVWREVRRREEGAG